MKWLLQWFNRQRRSRAVDQDDDDSSVHDRTTVVGERSIASVNRARSLQAQLSSWLAMGLMLALGIGLLAWYYSRTLSRQSQVQKTAQAQSKVKAQGEMSLPALGPVQAPNFPPSASTAEQILGPRPELPASNTEDVGSSASRPTTNAAYVTAPAYGAATEKTPEQIAMERRLSGPAYTNLESTVTSVTPRSSAAALNSGAPSSMNPGDTRLATLLQPTATPTVNAQVLPTERLLLPKGAFIDCTLETAMDSSLTGLTTCITATDTFGADGTVVLLERGTKLVGETRGEVQQGVSRLFVLWTEARTPTGVVVPLASPGTDELGRSGLAGNVNRHFLERFGAAILVSVIDGAVQSAVQSQRNSGAVIYNPSSSQDILTEVLKSTINIPPTVTKHQGDRIQVLVARDIDFRSVYELRATSATH